MIDRLFAWWNGATLGTLYDVFRRGSLVGEDTQGNRYFEERVSSGDGRRRRWVIYKGLAEPSRISSDWHGWLHHTFQDPPTIAPLPVQFWERAHSPNLTGTQYAYRPSGSLAGDGSRAPSSGDYEAWSPNA